MLKRCSVFLVFVNTAPFYCKSCVQVNYLEFMSFIFTTIENEGRKKLHKYLLSFTGPDSERHGMPPIEVLGSSTLYSSYHGTHSTLFNDMEY